MMAYGTVQFDSEKKTVTLVLPTKVSKPKQAQLYYMPSKEMFTKIYGETHKGGSLIQWRISSWFPKQGQNRVKGFPHGRIKWKAS